MRSEILLSEFYGASQGAPRRHLDGCNFRFYPHYKINKEKTKAAGYPQHEDVEFLEIINFAGERTCREVEDRDKRAYPEEYARFQAREQKPATGLWLREWCLMTPCGLADLEAFGLKTVEELSSLSDEVLNKNKHLQIWFKAANAWLKNVKSKQADCARLELNVEDLKKRIKQLETQLHLAHTRIEANEGNRFNA